MKSTDSDLVIEYEVSPNLPVTPDELSLIHDLLPELLKELSGERIEKE